MKAEDIKSIIIPDVHGRTFWKDAIPFIEKGVPTIFLGDYVDPYPFEAPNPLTGWNESEVVKNFQDIVDLAKEYINIVLLLGNHDLEYWDPEFPACRFMDGQAGKICEIFRDNAYHFNLAYDMDNVVYSHAGISKEWLGKLRPSMNCYDAPMVVELINSMFRNREERLMEALRMISHYRGGMDDVASMVWTDIHEWYTDFNEFGVHSFTPNLQVVGHTLQLKKEYTGNGFVFTNGIPISDKQENIICLDTRTVYAIDDNHKIVELSTIE